MSGLTKLIPPAASYFGSSDSSGNVTVSREWYLLLYNISLQVLGAGAGSPPVVYSPGGTLGTPSSGNLAECTGYTYANLAGIVPTWNQNTTGTAANATNATNATNLTGLTATKANLNTITSPLGTAAFTASTAYQPSVSTYTIATLPVAPTAGTKAYVSNGQAVPLFMGAVSTTGTTFAPVFYNGSAWLYG